MEKKYDFTGETRMFDGRTLRRIVALRDFAGVKTGDKGGWIEQESNLSQLGNAWVYCNARVFDNAEVSGDACVSGDARVSGNARVYDNAQVYGNAQVSGNAWVYGNAQVYGYARVGSDARVSGIHDYIVFKNFWSSGRYFTYTFSDKMWTVGCFHGTGDELINKAYADSEDSGWHYEQAVRYVEEEERRRSAVDPKKD